MYTDALIADFLEASECGNAELFESVFLKGLDPNLEHEGLPLVFSHLNMYTRGQSVSSLLKLMLHYGLSFPDEVLLGVFLDDAERISKNFRADFISKKYTLNCTFTPLKEVSLMHIAIEYGHLNAAKVLLKLGFNINEKAGITKSGLGGQTPIFHAVNQHQNFNISSLEWLLQNGAEILHTVKGFVWGETYSWETYIPAVNPISYALMGLLRQFQRKEADVYQIVSLLETKLYGEPLIIPKNIPNLYLNT